MKSDRGILDRGRTPCGSAAQAAARKAVWLIPLLATWIAGSAAPLPPGYGALGYDAPAPGTYDLPSLFPAADGEVLTDGGEPTRLHRLLGDRVVLLSFIYSTCSDAAGCPLATAVLHRVERRLARESDLAERVRLITLSFDPHHDTPEVMRLYRRGLASDGLDWRFLTTSGEAELQPILAAYNQPVQREYDERGEPLGTFSHLLRVYLVDRERRVRNIYSLSFLHPDLLVNDLRTLLMEPTAQAVQVAAAGAVGGDLRELLPGDWRGGYERQDYVTRSRSLTARRGQPADLLAFVRSPPLGLPAVPVPADNPVTAAKVALGRKLFYDRRLSLNNTISCAMCHVPEQGFTSNELATAVGFEGRSVRRNAPTVYNSAYLRRLFHDGREHSLEQQAWGPLLAPNEMANPSVGSVLERLGRLSDYDGLFEAAFSGRGATMETLGGALASYQRTLISGDSPFDRWYFGGEADALGPQARRGFDLFTGKGGCSACHTVGGEYALFTDDAMHNTGIGYRASMTPEPETRQVTVAPGVVLEVPRGVIESVSEVPANDLGLYEVTQDPSDRWKYRTASLRNVALTAPYMHDGSIGTLREVIEYYDAGGAPNPLLDPRVRPLGLTPQEMEDLTAFLRSLTGSNVATLVADALAAPVGDPFPQGRVAHQEGER